MTSESVKLDLFPYSEEEPPVRPEMKELSSPVISVLPVALPKTPDRRLVLF
jgi:hypothetical protein